MWFEVKTVPGYPTPEQPVMSAEVFRVTIGGKVTHWTNGTQRSETNLSPENIEKVRLLLRDLTVEHDPAVVVDHASTILTLYKDGKAVGGSASLRTEEDAIPNQVLSELQSATN